MNKEELIDSIIRIDSILSKLQFTREEHFILSTDIAKLRSLVEESTKEVIRNSEKEVKN